MKYKLTVYHPDYAKVGDDYERIEVRSYYTLDADGVQNLIGYMVEGSNGETKFSIRKIEEEA